MNGHQRLLAVAALVATLAIGGCGEGSGATADGGAAPAGATPQAAAGGSPMAATLAFAGSAKAPAKAYKIAYLTECVSNPYCQARLKGAKEAAAKLGAELRVFDANFSPNTQIKQVQDALQLGFDGYVLMPVADAPGCSALKMLKASGKPVATGNSPMCGNADYTPETVGFVGMQTQKYFEQHVAHAFETCKADCEAMAIGGFVGSDLFTRWENAIDAVAPKFPHVKVVVDQAGNFDPRVALQKTQDALRAHPGLDLVISSWDDMTRGAEQAIARAGKAPGKDVRIYSVGATKDGLARVTAGRWNAATILLPYEESYYPVVQLIRKLETGQDTPGFTNLAEAPVVADGPGTIFIDAGTAAKVHPEY